MSVTDVELVERLAAHRTLKVVPRPQLEWLADHGTLVRYRAGEVVGWKGAAIRSLYVILTGHVVIRVDRPGGARAIIDWRAGDVTGLLPYSRLSNPPGTSTVEEDTEMVMVPGEDFPEMIRDCHELTAALVHVMLDRARRFTTSDLHDEKMVSLGRLAAGLAHELNNPASAVARSAKELSARVFETEATALALGGLGLSVEQLNAIRRVRDRCGDAGEVASLSALERADRHDEVCDWLKRYGLSADIGEALDETALSVADLEPLADAVGRDALEYALRSIGATCRTRALVKEVEAAAERVHKLVASVKGFTHMDQTGVRKPVDIRQGLVDTLAVMGGKARAKSVTVTLDVPDDLPKIDGYGGELNQVWSNLIDNAIDAAPPSGQVEVCATTVDDGVVVKVADNGPGVPEKLRTRIFEPFFTTKPQGEGTGLGLDISRRLVRQHNGQIEVTSRPGRTEFRVILPRT